MYDSDSDSAHSESRNKSERDHSRSEHSDHSHSNKIPESVHNESQDEFPELLTDAEKMQLDDLDIGELEDDGERSKTSGGDHGSEAGGDEEDEDDESVTV